LAQSDALLDRPTTSGAPLLTVENIDAGYGKKRVLDDVSLTLGHGEAVAILGHNGAGKTTLLQAIFGLQPIWRGAVSFDGEMLTGHSARGAVSRGMAMIPSERFVFPDLTVFDNLRVSAAGLSETARNAAFDLAHAEFPILRERTSQLAGAMSGGEQRMVSLAMALIRKPRLLLLDEPSLGLSPAIAEQVMARVRELVKAGTSVILVEQNIPAALGVASRVYVLRGGRIILEESAAALAARGREGWWELF
jgi:branched-chain amino acid transport system ATP-binding protein